MKCHECLNSCSFFQLEHSYDLDELYGANYGYRSGLNYRMVQHPKKKVETTRKFFSLLLGADHFNDDVAVRPGDESVEQLEE